MPADAWVALVIGILTIVGTIMTASFVLGGRLSRQDSEMTEIKVSIDKMESIISAIAVDRERAAAVDRRVSKLEQWYDELRRGVGRIT